MSPKGGFQLEVSSLKLEVFLTADFTDGADFFSWKCGLEVGKNPINWQSPLNSENLL